MCTIKNSFSMRRYSTPATCYEEKKFLLKFKFKSDITNCHRQFELWNFIRFSKNCIFNLMTQPHAPPRTVYEDHNSKSKLIFMSVYIYQSHLTRKRVNT